MFSPKLENHASTASEDKGLSVYLIDDNVKPGTNVTSKVVFTNTVFWARDDLRNSKVF